MDKWRKIAEENGISYKVLWDRVNILKWDPEEAATKPLQNKPPKDVKWRELAKENGINLSTYRSRISRGWSSKKASTTPADPQIRADQKWLNLARQNGISYETFKYRVDELFWDPEDAATTLPMTRKASSKLGNKLKAEYKEIEDIRTFKDEDNLYKVTPKHLQIADKNGIKRKTAQARVYVYGWTVQDAITIPVDEPLKVPDQYDEYLELAKKNGIKKDTFKARTNRYGWTLKDAATIKPSYANGNPRRPDADWQELAVKNGIHRVTYSERIKRGWTTEEAATTPVLKSGEFLNEEMKQRALDGLDKFNRR